MKVVLDEGSIEDSDEETGFERANELPKTPTYLSWGLSIDFPLFSPLCGTYLGLLTPLYFLGFHISIVP